MGKLNIELFKKVRRKIKTAPLSYRQDTYAELDKRSPCGTAACIGGWADILSARNDSERKKRMAGEVDLDRAARALGLRGKCFAAEYHTERGVLFNAFPEDRWPSPFREQK